MRIMKNKTFMGILLAIFVSACGPSQKITNSWINPEAYAKDPYKSIFVMVLSPNNGNSFDVEDQMAKTINSRGNKAVRSTDVFPPNISLSETFTREELAAAIKKTGCDAVFVLAVLDVKSETYYQTSGNYAPMSYGMYGSYYGYYNYYHPYVYAPGYYTSNKTYYIESNFYDLEEDQLLWSIQSEANNPSSIDSFFKEYSYNLLGLLKKEGLITK
jgi:hypothetical protein